MYKASLSFLARNWPFANGSGSLIHYLGRNLDVGQGEVTCRTSDGFGMTVLANDLIGRHIIMTGAFDRSGVGALLRFAEPGDFCSDVGANIGYVSCVLLANVPGLTISCVEPQPLVVDLLRKNVSQFGDDRAHVLQQRFRRRSPKATCSSTGRTGAAAGWSKGAAKGRSRYLWWARRITSGHSTGST